eukprot:363857-Chlamydomonas_euryale.AAC.3
MYVGRGIQSQKGCRESGGPWGVRAKVRVRVTQSGGPWGVRVRVTGSGPTKGMPVLNVAWRASVGIKQRTGRCPMYVGREYCEEIGKHGLLARLAMAWPL